jgi:hypothetical protein
MNMARTIKIDNAELKRFSYSSNKTRKKKEIKAYFMIVCEGKKTEPNYFKSFKTVGKFDNDIQFEGGGISTMKVVDRAIELKKNHIYDRV